MIATELGNLSELNQLYRTNNQLTGMMPLELGNLNKLNELYLGNIQLFIRRFPRMVISILLSGLTLIEIF